MKEPESMDELLYFTNRTVGGKGHVRAWVFRIGCPKCGELMGKPVVKGKVKSRASEYVCQGCGHSELNEEHESKLKVNVAYTCPYCSHKGSAETDYKRKQFQGVLSYVFECGGCGRKLGITKKLKEGKN